MSHLEIAKSAIIEMVHKQVIASTAEVSKGSLDIRGDSPTFFITYII